MPGKRTILKRTHHSVAAADAKDTTEGGSRESTSAAFLVAVEQQVTSVVDVHEVDTDGFQGNGEVIAQVWIHLAGCCASSACISRTRLAAEE